MDEVVESLGHRHYGGSAGGVMPRRRSSPSDEATNRQSNRHAKHVLPTLKLGTFDGSKYLKTFLAKFEKCSDYYEWTEKEKLSSAGEPGRSGWSDPLGRRTAVVGG